MSNRIEPKRQAPVISDEEWRFQPIINRKIRGQNQAGPTTPTKPTGPTKIFHGPSKCWKFSKFCLSK